MFFMGKKIQDQLDSTPAFSNLSEGKQVRQLKKAVKEKQFTLYLQPKINLTTWKIQGVEMLLRWRHPEYGMLLPKTFLGPLEKAGLIEAISVWQLKKACKLYQYWQTSGLEPLNISLNIFSNILLKDSFFISVQNVIQTASIPTEQLEFEITDYHLFDGIGSQFDLINRYRDEGIRFSIKYTVEGLPENISINELPIDTINIDHGLTEKISHNPECRQIMQTVLGFAHAHQIQVVAEGVETAEQLIFLNATHCDIAQGFFLCHPLTLDDFMKLYQSGKQYNDLVDKISKQHNRIQSVT